MARTAEQARQDQPSPKDIGRHLRQVRKQQGLSRTVVARSAGLTRRELAAYERGRSEVPESDLWCLAGSCGVDVSDLLPRRDPLHIAADHSAIGVGDTVRRLRNPAEPDDMLREYLSMIYELRRVPPGAPIPLRQPDLDALADALGGTPESIEARLMQLAGVSHEEAVRLRTMILPPLSLPSPVREASHQNPYEQLSHADDSPAIEQFFSGPGPVDPFAPAGVEPYAPAAPPTVDPFTGQPATADAFAPSPPAPEPFGAPGAPMPLGPDPPSAPPAEPYAAAPPLAAPPPGWAPPGQNLTDPAPGWAPPPAPEMAEPAADPAASAGPLAPPVMAPADAPLVPPSDPFAGPVDSTTSAAELRDPFAPPSAEDPLAPLPLPPDPFAAAPETPAAWVEPAVPEPTSSNGNGNGVVVDDPFAPPPMPAPPAEPEPAPVARDEHPSGFNGAIIDAIVVDDPMRGRDAPAADVEPETHEEPDTHDAPGATDPRPIITSSEPIAWHATTDAPSTAPASLPSEPRFEKATADWQVGGVFPATAMADDGTLALRRADARWALTNLAAGGDAIIETSFDLRTGSGFGIMFRASVTNDRISGYSFDMDPVAGGGGYLVRLWDGSRQHWRPLAHAAVTDPACLFGHHVVRITLVGDQLSVQIDGDPVLEVPALSRATLDVGREPCRGDRVGIQAWATTEVTVDTFRVAQL
jgi:transcriptional regulator with XRE-family HTH domain